TNQSTGAERFTWDLGDGTTFSGEQPEAYVYESPGTYTITVEGEIGNCTYATQQTIEVLNTSVAIANVITPNGDAYNETFELVGEPFQIEIFNRWGKRVFQSSNYQNDWGAGVEAGMYYYLIASETGQICKGWVQVLR
ncbi:MAG: gliding motility-associated C-terminal domain-containing protein, partial [Thermonemataceae bacterium]